MAPQRVPTPDFGEPMASVGAAGGHASSSQRGGAATGGGTRQARAARREAPGTPSPFADLDHWLADLSDGGSDDAALAPARPRPGPGRRAPAAAAWPEVASASGQRQSSGQRREVAGRMRHGAIDAATMPVAIAARPDAALRTATAPPAPAIDWDEVFATAAAAAPPPTFWATASSPHLRSRQTAEGTGAMTSVTAAGVRQPPLCALLREQALAQPAAAQATPCCTPLASHRERQHGTIVARSSHRRQAVGYGDRSGLAGRGGTGGRGGGADPAAMTILPPPKPVSLSEASSSPSWFYGECVPVAEPYVQTPVAAVASGHSSSLAATATDSSHWEERQEDEAQIFDDTIDLEAAAEAEKLVATLMAEAATPALPPPAPQHPSQLLAADAARQPPAPRTRDPRGCGGGGGAAAALLRHQPPPLTGTGAAAMDAVATNAGREPSSSSGCVGPREAAAAWREPSPSWTFASTPREADHCGFGGASSSSSSGAFPRSCRSGLQDHAERYGGQTELGGVGERSCWEQPLITSQASWVPLLPPRTAPPPHRYRARQSADAAAAAATAAVLTQATPPPRRRAGAISAAAVPPGRGGPTTFWSEEESQASAAEDDEPSLEVSAPTCRPRKKHNKMHGCAPVKGGSTTRGATTAGCGRGSSDCKSKVRHCGGGDAGSGGGQSPPPPGGGRDAAVAGEKAVEVAPTIQSSKDLDCVESPNCRSRAASPQSTSPPCCERRVRLGSMLQDMACAVARLDATTYVAESHAEAELANDSEESGGQDMARPTQTTPPTSSRSAPLASSAPAPEALRRGRRHGSVGAGRVRRLTPPAAVAMGPKLRAFSAADSVSTTRLDSETSSSRTSSDEEEARSSRRSQGGASASARASAALLAGLACGGGGGGGDGDGGGGGTSSSVSAGSSLRGGLGGTPAAPAPQGAPTPPPTTRRGNASSAASTARRGGGGSEAPAPPPTTRRGSASSAASTARRSGGGSEALTECALCGTLANCDKNSCFCAPCGARLQVLGHMSPIDAEQPLPDVAESPATASADGASSCVLCGQRFICNPDAQSTVLCVRCLTPRAAAAAASTRGAAG